MPLKEYHSCVQCICHTKAIFFAFCFLVLEGNQSRSNQNRSDQIRSTNRMTVASNLLVLCVRIYSSTSKSYAYYIAPICNSSRKKRQVLYDDASVL